MIEANSAPEQAPGTIFSHAASNNPTQHSSAPVLSARALRRAYGSTLALDGVDLEILTGESVAIMGPSGSGKSTLLHTLAGIEKPDSGSVLLASSAGQQDITTLGESARSKLRREAFGFVFQSGLLIPELTAVENVAMALMINGLPRAAALPQANQWLSALGLAGMEERRIGQLSGGQAQRVAIARAQVTGAKVIFADEPTGALDSATGTEVLNVLMESTVGRGNTLVMVTHDADVAARCDRIISLRDGKITSETRPGSPNTIAPGAQH
ncbi:ABC transporter ATP-binding protein [Arthrobacter sp. MYb227]|uniref:ABC transporter ATP-binding protein n=1 Tax=Arthrobacter sp. MYb227 TaxID=1848601 RepID=UPI000CFBBE6A|nr:ABC transporter ATP-binding protein [Arthrobacter sp. MYb227]PQZ86437.1 ABC transporter ATP-binding protein [Arthrobacter sp. MYb227]